MNLKIIEIVKLSIILNKKKLEGKKVVLCHGVFDLLHIGHIKHFEEARKQGDVLIVSLTPDKFVNKGPSRPHFTESLRAEAISAIKCVDYVVINNSHSATSIIKKIKPSIYCKGPDYKNVKKDITGEINKEIKCILENGGKIYFTKGQTFSSSNLINNYLDGIDKKTKNIFKTIKRKNTNTDDIKKIFQNIKKIKVLVIGEVIIDKYTFCEALGKSGKEPVLVLKDKQSEEYLGGAAAIARHVSSFTDNTHLFSMIGEKEEYLKKIKKDLPKNVKFSYIKKKNSPTILKTRFLDYISNNKIFGVDQINDNLLDDNQNKLLINRLSKIIPKYDLVITSDYGHGFLSHSTAKLICKKSKYLSLNAQVNSANIGYHSLRNYKNSKCVVINQRELEYELRERGKDVKILIKKLVQRDKIENLIVTQGKEGAILYNRKLNKFLECGGLATKVIDKIGSGDAFLSLISLLLVSKVSLETSLLLGSIAAAQSTESIGNKNNLNKIKIIKSVEHLIK